MPCSNASGERTFSVLKRVKNYLRSSLSNEKTSALSILCIENEIVKNISWTSLIKKFSKLKARKKTFAIKLFIKLLFTTVIKKYCCYSCFYTFILTAS